MSFKLQYAPGNHPLRDEPLLLSIATSAELATTTPPDFAGMIHCRGEATEGDGGDGYYVKHTTDPGIAGTIRSPDGRWWAPVVATGLRRRLGLLETFAVAQAAFVPSWIDAITVEGYIVPGIGRADYVRVASEPAHPGKLQTGDGTWWELAPQRGEFDAQAVGCLPNTGSAVTSQIQNVVAAATALNATAVFADGTYRLDGTLTAGSGFRLRGSGKTVFQQTGPQPMLEIGDLDSGWVTNEANTLASDNLRGETTVTLTSGKGANLSAGEWVVFVSEALCRGDVSQKQAEFAYLEEVNGDTLVLAGPLKDDYLTSDTAEVRRVNWIENLEIANIEFDGAVYDGSSNANFYNVLSLHWCLEPQLDRVHCRDCFNLFVSLTGCLNAKVTNLTARNQASIGTYGGDGYGYSVVELGLNSGLIVTGMHAERVRHAYTTATLDTTYGVPQDTLVANSSAIACRLAPFDTHPLGYNQTFDGCVTRGSLDAGFLLRAVGGRVINCLATACLGPGLRITDQAIDSEVHGFTCEYTNHGGEYQPEWRSQGAVFDAGTRSNLNGIRVLNSHGPGMELGGNAVDCAWFNIEIRNPNRVDTTRKHGIVATDNTASGTFTVKNYRITTDNKTQHGVVVTATGIKGLFEGGVVQGAFTGNVASLAGGIDTQVLGVDGPNRLTVGKDVGVTIASGALDLDAVTNVVGGRYSVTGEGDANDDLDQIDGALDGAVIVLRKGTGTITVKHATSNIRLNGAADCVLDSTYDCIVLMKLTSQWVELTRSVA